MVEVARNLAHFYAHESCGQCTPCREGGHWIEKIFTRIATGRGLPGDTDLIKNVCDQISGHTICTFGDALATPALSIMQKFPKEFESKIRQASLSKANTASVKINQRVGSKDSGVAAMGSNATTTSAEM
jgi:NADH-quinone oxidoreductase subunit F